MTKDHDRTDTLCPDCGDTYCSKCDSACPAVCMEHKGHADADIALLEACRTELITQWEANHYEHCSNLPCAQPTDCQWPEPKVLSRLNERLEVK